jgi:hypothetical protein
MIIFNSEGGFRRDPSTPDQFADLQTLANLQITAPAPRDNRDKYQRLHAAGLLTGTIKSCRALREQRNAMWGGGPGSSGQRAMCPAVVHGKYAGRAAIGRAKRSVKTAVPLGTVDVLTGVKARNRKLREWSLGLPGNRQQHQLAQAVHVPARHPRPILRDLYRLPGGGPPPGRRGPHDPRPARLALGHRRERSPSPLLFGRPD